MTTDVQSTPAPARSHRVFIGDFCVAAAPDLLTIHGLGSCVGLLLHDPKARISALGHILLPEPPRPDAPGIPGRFASTAVPAMIEALGRSGGVAKRLVAKLVGAAQMFQFEKTVEPRRVGARNLEATLAMLEQFSIPVAGQDTGGSYGRTVIVEAASGRMRVRAVRLEETIL